MRAYQQLTYEQRCQIYGLLKTDLQQGEIAAHIGVSPVTISRELRRNTRLGLSAQTGPGTSGSSSG